MATVALTGATGHLGSVLLRRLLADPAIGSVTTVARRPVATPAGAAGRHRHVRADLRSPQAVAALAGAEVCYHLAFQLWSGGDPAAMAATNAAMTRSVLGARPQAVVVASSAAVYGAWPDNPLPLGEDDPPRPNPECPYAAHKLDAERRFLDAGGAVVVRLAAVLGPGADPAVARAARGYRLAVPAVRGVTQAVQFLHEDDAAGALLAAGRHAGAGGEGVFNASPAGWLSAADIARVAGGPVVALPRRLLLGAAEVGRRARLAPFGADRAVLVAGPLALDPARAAGELGWRPRMGSEEVLAGALRPGVTPAGGTGATPGTAGRRGPPSGC